jgi:hypothetical protein
VLNRIGRRGLELLIALFALLGFFYVPLGKKTGFEHAKAIFSTRPAQEAGREIVQAGDRIKTKMIDEVRRAPDSDAGAPAEAKPEALSRATRASATFDDTPDASLSYRTASVH